MTINKAKASAYNTVTMEGVNRQTLKTCAAELETVVKRLKYAIEGQY